MYAALPAPFVSSGTVYVMENGKVVADYDDPNRDGDLFLPPEGMTLWLLSGPTLSQVVSSGAEISGEFNTKIVLDGTSDVVVAQYAGMLTLAVDEVQGVAELSVTTDTGTVFRYTFADSGGSAQASGNPCGSIPGACCCANCPRGSCVVYGNGPCSCFCGLFGEPVCIKVVRRHPDPAGLGSPSVLRTSQGRDRASRLRPCGRKPAMQESTG